MPNHSLSRSVLRLLFVLGVVAGALVLTKSQAFAQGDSGKPPECSECHVDITEAWQTGTHAQAYSDPTFQEKWQEAGSPAQCLACHTTGFDARTGEYDHEGVTCAACHGQTPADHPPAPVNLDPTLLSTVQQWEESADKQVILDAALAIDPSIAICASCHATTFTEWEQSAHGAQQLACVVCHSPHPQQVRFVSEEEPNALCLNCHGDYTSNEQYADNSFAHLLHVEQQCSDCHWHRAKREDLLAHYESGQLFPTGHMAEVETRACVDCHEELTEQETGDVNQEITTELDLVSGNPLQEARVRIEELEQEVDTVKAQGANSSALRMVQGIVLGVVLGGIVVFAVARFGRRQASVVNDADES